MIHSQISIIQSPNRRLLSSTFTSLHKKDYLKKEINTNIAERTRFEENYKGHKNWLEWGPYLSER